MNVSQVLMLAGRLDDAPGVDTPRERFRRFLGRQVTDLASTRVVIQQCQETAGEQHRRALQDAVVLAGGYLGFRTIFGRYHHGLGAAPVHGEWESRRRLRILVSVCAGPAAALELRALANAVRDRAENADNTPRVGLCVTTPLFPGRPGLEESLQEPTYFGLRMISAEAMLHMADMVLAGRLTHDQVLQVFNPDANLDRVIDLLERSAVVAPRSAEPVPAAPVPPPPVDAERGRCWLAVIRLDPATPTAQFVESVFVNRQILPVTTGADVHRQVQPGDAVCVSLAGVGVVAHAQVSGVVVDEGIQVLVLSDVSVYGTPVTPASDVVRRLERGLAADSKAVAAPVSREEFELLTRAAAATSSR